MAKGMKGFGPPEVPKKAASSKKTKPAPGIKAKQAKRKMGY